MKMKAILSFVLCAVLLFCLSLGVTAQNLNGQVFDLADLLTTAEEEYLNSRINTLTDDSGMDIAVVLIDDDGGKTSAAFADDFFDHEGYDDGLLMLINMDEREVWISTYATGAAYFTDGIIDDMTYDLVEPLSDGDFAGAAELFLDQCEAILSRPAMGQSSSVAPDPRPVQPAPSSKLEDAMLLAFPAALIVGGITAGIMALCHRSLGNKTQNTIHYISNGRINWQINRDIFLTSNVKKVRIQQNNSSGSGGGHSHSTMHRSSSGRMHGGGGRKF